MAPNQLVDHAKSKMSQAVAHFEEELKKVRTGRAHTSMLDSVVVEAYGTPMPLNQVATVSAPEPQLLQVTPFDPNNLQAIATSIRDNPSLGMNPMDDGRAVRVPVPPLTEERRRELVKTLGGKVEETMISLRNARHEALKEAENAKRDKSITEDDFVSVKKELDQLVDQQKTQIDSLTKAKEAEILKV